MIKNLPYLLALHTIEGLGPVRLKILIDNIKDPKEIFLSKTATWQELNIPGKVIDNWRKVKNSLDVENYSKNIENQGVKVLNIFEENYPKLLKQIPDPPMLIYYKGSIDKIPARAIAVVGTRKISSYGKTVTEKFTKELVEFGFTIISGLARGVDSLAHKSTLEANGVTWAVLGSGLNNIYPPENLNLTLEIIKTGGAILSEFPPDYPPSPGLFPARNRIISGLSLGVLVTEAAEDSGSLITARLALDQGREVFAVPGPITSSLSKGPADLIKQGAKLVYSVEDILEELGIEKVSVSRGQLASMKLSKVEEEILSSLENEQKHIDEICRQLKKSSSEVSASLIKMEIQGLVKNLGSGIYLKAF